MARWTCPGCKRTLRSSPGAKKHRAECSRYQLHAAAAEIHAPPRTGRGPQRNGYRVLRLIT